MTESTRPVSPTADDTDLEYPDPAGFPDGDTIDSAAVDEPADGYQPPTEPEAEPVDTEPGGDL